MGAFTLGNAIGWSSPATPALQEESRYKHFVDDNEKRWIGSLVNIGCLIASQVTIQIIDYDITQVNIL